jgi:hypothetical protein
MELKTMLQKANRWIYTHFFRIRGINYTAVRLHGHYHRNTPPVSALVAK